MAVAGLVEATEDELGRRGSVGIGIPGSLEPKSRLGKGASSTWILGKPVEADLQKALADSFAFCDAAWAAVTDAKAAEPVTMFGMPQTRIAVLSFNTAHDFEHYGNIVTYMRIKGMVPPWPM